jgi:glucose/arabinose dehydrogenase
VRSRHCPRPRIVAAVAAVLACGAAAGFAGRAAQASATSPSAALGSAASPAKAASPAASPSPGSHLGALPAITLKRIATGLSGPLGVTAPPDDTHRLFIVEKRGTIRIVKDGVRLPIAFLDISRLVSQAHEQGLLCLAFDPRFRTTRRLFVSYSDKHDALVIVQYRVGPNPDRAVIASRRVLLVISHPQPRHYGAQLAFGPDGLLYIGSGDGGYQGDPHGYAQDPHTLLGKILRMDVNARAPKATIYAKGLRNPWRFSFDRLTGDLWIGDVGQDSWEEIDFLRRGTAPGANFGWNGWEAHHVYDLVVANHESKARLVFPVAEYPHPTGEAVIGGYVYRGSAIPGLRGTYFFGDYVTRRVWVKRGWRRAMGAMPAASTWPSQLTSFGQDARGELYVCTQLGTVYEIVPAR